MRDHPLTFHLDLHVCIYTIFVTTFIVRKGVYSKIQDSKVLVYWTIPSGNQLQVNLCHDIPCDVKDVKTHRAISFSALSTESDPWQMLRPTARAKSPRMVPIVNHQHTLPQKPVSYAPGAESRGLVAPSMTRPVLTASNPVHTMPTTGPEAMYLMRPGKKGLPLRSA